MLVPLTQEEADLLARLLDARISDLREEIIHAESHDVKQGLKEMVDQARRLRAKLERPEVDDVPVT